MDGVNKAVCLLQQTMITPCHFAGCFLAHSRGREEGKRRGFRTGGAWVLCGWKGPTTCTAAVIHNLSHRTVLQFDFEGGVEGIWLHFY